MPNYALQLALLGFLVFYGYRIYIEYDSCNSYVDDVTCQVRKLRLTRNVNTLSCYLFRSTVSNSGLLYSRMYSTFVLSCLETFMR